MNQTQDSTNADLANVENVASYKTAIHDNVLLVAGEINSAHAYTELRMADGRVLRLPTSLLTSELDAESVPDEHLENNGTTVIPLIEERLEISRRTVPTGTVRLDKTVQEYQQALDEPLAVRTYDIERIILNQPVEAAPSVRYEGDTTVYPLVEEQLILTKQLILKEEVRVTRRDTERRDTRVVTLRREHLSVERQSLVEGTLRSGLPAEQD